MFFVSKFSKFNLNSENDIKTRQKVCGTYMFAFSFVAVNFPILTKIFVIYSQRVNKQSYNL